MTFELKNFFKYYKPDNPKHGAAIDDLAMRMLPELLSDDANWVKIYRTPLPQSFTTQAFVDDSSPIPLGGLELIKKFEDFRTNAYRDPKTRNLPITIGYGSTKKPDGVTNWVLGETISEPEAAELLKKQILIQYLPPLTKIPGWDEFNDNQKGCLLSFAYNLGAHFYGNNDFATITGVLRDKRYGDMRKALLLYCNPRDKNVTQGLKRRRSAEADLWAKGVSAGESSIITFTSQSVQEVPPDLTPATIPWGDMSFHLTKNFTVGENLQRDSRRIPHDPKIQANILKIMREAQKIRDDYDKPLIITSGYRPPAINSANGGVRGSQHLTGNAIDIAPTDGNAWALQKWLDQYWYGFLGLGAKRGFVHLDCRNGRGWKTGGSKAGTRFPY